MCQFQLLSVQAIEVQQWGSFAWNSIPWFQLLSVQAIEVQSKDGMYYDHATNEFQLLSVQAIEVQSQVLFDNT